MYLSREDYRKRIELSPIVSFDLIIIDEHGRVLVGMRKNKPAKDYFFVPGGAILKGETFPEAMKRITSSELGVEIPLKKMTALGAFEHFYPDNFNDDLCGTHYVAFGFKYKMNGEHLIDNEKLFEQHSNYVWMSVKDIIERMDVHKYTKAYFMDGAENSLKNAHSSEI